MASLHDIQFESLLMVVGSIIATIIIGYLFAYLARKSLKKYNPLLAEAIARYGSWTIYMAGLLFSLELLNLKLETILVFVVFIGILVIVGLRDVLPNYFTRQFIEMYKPFGVGDWIQFNDIVGRVVELNDLYTQLVTLSQVRVYIPNSMLARNVIRNLSRGQGVDVEVSFSITTPQNLDAVLEKIRKAITESIKEEGLKEPEIYVVSFGKDSMDVKVKFKILNPQRIEEARSRVLRDIYSAIRSVS